MWGFFLLGSLLLSCIIFIARQEIKQKNIRRKTQILSMASDWILAIHEEDNAESIVYSFDSNAVENPLQFSATWTIQKTYSKRQQLFKPLRATPDDINNITSIIQRAFKIVGMKAELTRDLKRSHSIYLISLKNGRNNKSGL